MISTIEYNTSSHIDFKICCIEKIVLNTSTHRNFLEEFEDTKGVIRIRKSKRRHTTQWPKGQTYKTYI